MEKLNSIYAKTYNFVYLRAKTILEKEEDIQQLMKEVYLKAVAEDVEEANLYEWFGKQVYILGCGRFRKKKVREAELIELDAQQYSAQKSIDREKTKEVICEALEELPDMYHATLYACYYDHMKIKDVSAVMGYNVGAIINRLNYVHKYLDKALLNYQEENKEKVQFSVEMVCEALRDWSAKNQLSEVVAQNIYAAICRELGQTAENGDIEAGVTGANCRMAMTDVDDISAVCEELEKYSVKKQVNKKQIALIVSVGALILLAVVGVMVLGKSGKKEEENRPAIEKEDDGVEVDNESTAEEVDEEETDTEEKPTSEESTASDTDYILPKSDKEKLTRADLEGLTKEQLRLARNEIYARHGMIFGVDDLDKYFATKSWYKPTISFKDFYDTVEMSLIEEENVILIQQVEKEK
ncbi:MAG: YARHG domain-containing protein [Tyzzerella sp.]|nr:YARHG domain-containing protein [Tyzzerella sp.]